MKPERLREQVLAVGTQFEGLLSEVTVTLDDLHVDELDEGIQATLREIAVFFHADGAFVLSAAAEDETDPEREEEREGAVEARRAAPGTWSWEVSRIPGGHSLAAVLRAEEGTLRRMVAQRQIGNFPTASDVPEPFRRAGVRSLVVVPLVKGETVAGCLGVIVCHSERPWSDGLLRRVRLLGDRLTEALERRTAAAGRQARARFERLLAELTTALLDGTTDDEDEVAVEAALQSIAEVAGGDRAVLFHARGPRLEPEHAWVDDTLDAPEAGEYRREGALRWLGDRLARGETVAVERVENLPGDAARERRHFRRAGCRSVLRIPLFVAGRFVAVLGIDATATECRWTAERCERLRLAGRLLVWAMERAGGPPTTSGDVSTGSATAVPVGLAVEPFTEAMPSLRPSAPDPVVPAAPAAGFLPSLDRLPAGASVHVLGDPERGRELVLRLPLDAPSGSPHDLGGPSALASSPAVLPEPLPTGEPTHSFGPDVLTSSAPLAPTGTSLRDMERAHIRRELERCRWIINGPGHAAERLGMPPSTLRHRMRKLGIERPGDPPPRRSG